MHSERPLEPVQEHLRAVSDGMSKLVRDHVQLAAAELKDDARRAGKDMALIGAGVFLLLVGYATLVFAAAWALGERIGTARGFLVLAGFHVVVGAFLSLRYADRLRGADKPGRLEETSRALSEDKHFVQDVKHALKPARGGHS